MVQNHHYDLVSSRWEEVPDTFLLKRKVAKSWFFCVVLHKELLIDPPLVCSHLLMSAIDRGLCVEWNSQWCSEPGVVDAHKVFLAVGTPWLLEHIRD